MAPSCHATADRRTNELETPSRHGGSRYATRGTFDHRAITPADLAEEGMPGPIRSSDLESEVELHDPVLSEM